MNNIHFTERTYVERVDENIAISYTDSVEFALKYIIPKSRFIHDCASEAYRFLRWNWKDPKDFPLIKISMTMDSSGMPAITLKVSIDKTGLAQAEMFTTYSLESSRLFKFKDIVESVFADLHRNIIRHCVCLKLNPPQPLVKTKIDYSFGIQLSKLIVYMSVCFVALLVIFLIFALITL